MMIRGRFMALTAFVLLATGCATPTSEREMNAIASALTKLSAAVDATVRYDSPPADLSDTELVRIATAHDPSLALPFAKLDVRVQRDGQNSSVLVCRARAGQAMLEDAGCTTMMERHHWRSPTALACVPTINLVTACTR
jgi:hypothetical protein